jgi:hypothetical protein
MMRKLAGLTAAVTFTIGVCAIAKALGAHEYVRLAIACLGGTIFVEMVRYWEG